jgi:CRP-like cAMP-binding protein
MKLTNKDTFELILANISRHIKLEQSEIDYFISLLKSRKLKKKQYLLQAGDICRHEYFINKGCLRAYSTDDEGVDHILQLGIEGWWIGDMYSFLTGTAANYHIDALEDSEVLMIDKNSLEELYKTVPKFERFFRIIIQNAFVATQRRVIENLSEDAEERYLQFINRYPAFEQRVPQNQIASYLGITPESLSRIRRQLAAKK